jgi:hypothetical protein
MRNDIVGKLSVELRRPIKHERQVVYILVEIRKLLDHVDPDRTTWEALRTFCNWPLHTNLTSGWAKKPIELMNEVIQRKDGMLELLINADRRKQVQSIFSLDEIYTELIQFLKQQGIGQFNVLILQEWATFLKLYFSVVADCPLTFTKDLPFDHVKQVTVRVYEVPEDVKAENANCAAMFGVTWVFATKSGARREFNMPLCFEKPDPDMKMVNLTPILD